MPRKPVEPKIEKHVCVADTQSMMRADAQAPIYKCLYCKALVYSNGKPVNAHDYNIQIALNLVKEMAPPYFWLVQTIATPTLQLPQMFLGIFSSPELAAKRLWSIKQFKTNPKHYRLEKPGQMLTNMYYVQSKPRFVCAQIICATVNKA